MSLFDRMEMRQMSLAKLLCTYSDQRTAKGIYELTQYDKFKGIFTDYTSDYVSGLGTSLILISDLDAYASMGLFSKVRDGRNGPMIYGPTERLFRILMAVDGLSFKFENPSSKERIPILIPQKE